MKKDNKKDNKNTISKISKDFYNKEFSKYSVNEQVNFLYVFFKKIKKYKDNLSHKHDELYHEKEFLDKYVEKYNEYVKNYNNFLKYINMDFGNIKYFDFYKRSYLSDLVYEDFDDYFKGIKSKYDYYISNNNTKILNFTDNILIKRINKDLTDMKSDIESKISFLDVINEYEKNIEKDEVYFGMFLRFLLSVLVVFDKYIHGQKSSEQNYFLNIPKLSVRYLKPRLFYQIANFIDNNFIFIIYNDKNNLSLRHIKNTLKLSNLEDKNFLYEYYVNLSGENKKDFISKLKKLIIRYSETKAIDTFKILNEYLEKIEKVINEDIGEMVALHKKEQEELYKEYGGEHEYQVSMAEEFENYRRQEEESERELRERDAFFDSEKNMQNKDDISDEGNDKILIEMKSDDDSQGYYIRVNKREWMHVRDSNTWSLFFEIIKKGYISSEDVGKNFVSNINHSGNTLRNELKDELKHESNILHTIGGRVMLEDDFVGKFCG